MCVGGLATRPGQVEPTLLALLPHPIALAPAPEGLAVLDYGISSGWAGLYEVTPDRNQIIDRATGVDGLLVISLPLSDHEVEVLERVDRHEHPGAFSFPDAVPLDRQRELSEGVVLLEEARERAIDELERIKEETGEKQHTLIVDDELDLDWEQVPDDLVDKSDATPDDFGRIAAMTAKQVIQQSLREAEREQVFAEYADREGDIINGQISRFEAGSAIMELGKAEAILPRADQAPQVPVLRAIRTVLRSLFLKT